MNDVVLAAGETYELRDSLALRYLDRGLAVAAADVEAKADEPAEENKDLGAAEENKSDPPAPKRRGGRKPAQTAAADTVSDDVAE